jgi:hypothetical protein
MGHEVPNHFPLKKRPAQCAENVKKVTALPDRPLSTLPIRTISMLIKSRSSSGVDVLNSQPCWAILPLMSGT